MQLRRNGCLARRRRKTVAHTIVFPRALPRLEWDRDSLSLSVSVDGEPVKVLVSNEALVHRFGARSFKDQEELDRSFVRDILSIQEIAKTFIEQERITPQREVLITTKDLMRVVFRTKIYNWGEGETLVRHATRRLEEVVGPAAPHVTAEWDLGEDERGKAVFVLRLSDGSVSVSATFTPEEMAAGGLMRLRFIRLWGDLLQERSHRQLQELTSSRE
jgi:hypothetical protein